MSRDAPMMIRRIRKRKTPPAAASARSAAAYRRTISTVAPSRRSSIREFQDPRAGEADGRGGDDAKESENKRTAIPEHITQQTTTRRH